MKKAKIAILSVSLIFMCVMIGFFIGRLSAKNHVILSSQNTSTDNADSAAETVSVIENGRININLATSQQLQMLPNIGDVLAERIVTYRSEHGPFDTVDDLTLVDGIGEKRLEALRQYITVGG